MLSLSSAKTYVLQRSGKVAAIAAESHTCQACQCHVCSRNQLIARGFFYINKKIQAFFSLFVRRSCRRNKEKDLLEINLTFLQRQEVAEKIFAAPISS
jgi:hypothetical protein